MKNIFNTNNVKPIIGDKHYPKRKDQEIIGESNMGEGIEVVDEYFLSKRDPFLMSPNSFDNSPLIFKQYKS